MRTVGCVAPSRSDHGYLLQRWRRYGRGRHTQRGQVINRLAPTDDLPSQQASCRQICIGAHSRNFFPPPTGLQRGPVRGLVCRRLLLINGPVSAHLMTTSRNLFQSAGLKRLKHIARPLISFNSVGSSRRSCTRALSSAFNSTSMRHFSSKL